MLPEKLWKILNTDSGNSIVDVILKNRDLPPNHLEPFKLSDRLHSPYLLPDMEKAVARIIRAIDNGEKIFIFGDYDVDGVTSTAIMVYFFRKIGYPVEYALPHREKDGYGLRPSAVDQAAEMGMQLIITVDNGITAHDAIDHAKSLGIDVVVTDHHLQEGDLPDACAVINPNRTDSEYPFKTICGVAVAFKLLHALSEKLMQEDDFKQFLLNQLDLVAIGTIADVMPLRDENYALVKFGLKVLSGSRKPGLMALKKISGVKEKVVTPISVGYFLAPRLNAAGRMEEARISVELLITESKEEAQELSAHLDSLNRKRQTLQSSYLEYALNLMPADDAIPSEKVIFVENEEWLAGLIGLVSGRLKEKYSRPAFVFTRDENGNYVGSARSIDAFHVTNALTQFNHYFLNYGGHHKAAGLTISAENYSQFKKEFIDYANEALSHEELIPEVVIDSVIDIDQLNLNTARVIQEIGPFGETNAEPILLLKSVYVRDMMLLSNGKHLKLSVQRGNQLFECIWWGGGCYKDDIMFGDTIDVAFRVNINNWRGTERLQLTVEDLKKVEVL